VSGRPLVIGSRGSRLALWQAHWLQERIESAGRQARIQTFKTSGDRFVDRSLAVIGGKGVFVKEIEEALAAGTVDIAIHSLKDLPTEQPEGLRVVCVPEREDPHDLLLIRGGEGFESVPKGAVLGTGSPRRACQVRALRPDLTIRELRGNVETRIGKLERGEYAAILLALAGVRRLGIATAGTVLSFDEMLPAVGQGALAVEARADDRDLAAFLAQFHHRPTAAAVAAERAFLRGLGGGCQAPIAAVAEVVDGLLMLRGLVADPGGERILRDRSEGPVGEAESIGDELARALLARGAGDLIGGGAPPAEAP
jgi:hydroxymethylbilane synthase